MGFKGTHRIMVAQLGFDMMPLCQSTSSGFISGITRGTDGSSRKELPLSMTTAPFLTKTGASTLLTGPAAKKAMSMPFILSSSTFSTVNSLPLKVIFFPASLSWAKSLMLSIGKSLSSRIFSISVPTAPVAPTTAM